MIKYVMSNITSCGNLMLKIPYLKVLSKYDSWKKPQRLMQGTELCFHRERYLYNSKHDGFYDYDYINSQFSDVGTIMLFLTSGVCYRQLVRPLKTI